MEEWPNGDILWNIIPFEILGDSTLEISEDVWNKGTNLQKVFTDTSEKPLKKLSEFDAVMYKLILTSLSYDDYIPRHGETKSSRYKYTKKSLDEHVDKILTNSIQSESESDDQTLNIITPSYIFDSYTRLKFL